MTYFVDRDLGPTVGGALRSIKVDVVMHHERFGPREPDDQWIKAVTDEGLIILTRDRHIRTRKAERDAFEAAGARVFVVVTGTSTPLDDLRSLLIAWPVIEGKIASMDAPFMFGVSREGRVTQYIPVQGPGGPAERAAEAHARRDARQGKRSNE